MLASWAGCFYFLITTLIAFLQYGYNTNYDYVAERPTVFPAIDICNLNPYDFNTDITKYVSVGKVESLDSDSIQSINNDDGLSDEENPYDDDTDNETARFFQLSREVSINVAATSSNTTNLKGKKGIAEAVIVKNLMRLEYNASKGAYNLNDFGYKMKDMLISCKFKGKACSENDFQLYHNFFYGNCYRFNGGYNSSNQQTSYQKITKAGWKYGLQLELYTGDNSTLSISSGFRILIHNQSDIAVFPEEDGVDIQTGLITNIAISKTMIKRLGAPYYECMGDLTDSTYDKLIAKSKTMQNMKNVLGYKSYDQNVCVKLCLQKYTFDKCNCTDFTLPKYFQNQTDIACYTETQFNCTNINQETFFNSDDIDNCMNDCPDECEFNDYATSISSSKYPSNWFKNFYTMNDETKSVYPDYVAAVNIYYDQLTYNLISQSPAFTAEVFFGSFGGSSFLINYFVNILCILNHYF